MSIFFVEENDKHMWWNLRKIQIKQDKIIINKDICKMKIKQKIKLVNSLRKILLDMKCKKIIISNNLKNDKEFINLLESNNINVIDGKWLFKMLIPEITEKIVKKSNMKQENLEISFTINQNTKVFEKYIELFAKKYKRVNIITNHISKFKKLEEKLYNNNGILVTVANNRRKSLLKTDIIINVDFPKEVLNKYTLNDKAIIITIDEEIKIKKKRFCGIIINNYNIELKNEEEFELWCKENKICIENYNKNDLYDGYSLINGLNKEKINIFL